MSQLPQLDPQKVYERRILKLEEDLKGYRERETQLEVLAEALRDERDEARQALAATEAELSEYRDETVPDITSLEK